MGTTTDPLRLAVRVVAALAVLGGGLIHLKLYNDSYKNFPNDNLVRSFLLNVIASIVLAVTLSCGATGSSTRRRAAAS